MMKIKGPQKKKVLNAIRGAERRTCMPSPRHNGNVWARLPPRLLGEPGLKRGLRSRQVARRVQQVHGLPRGHLQRLFAPPGKPCGLTSALPRTLHGSDAYAFRQRRLDSSPWLPDIPAPQASCGPYSLGRRRLWEHATGPCGTAVRACVRRRELPGGAARWQPRTPGSACGTACAVAGDVELTRKLICQQSKIRLALHTSHSLVCSWTSAMALQGLYATHMQEHMLAAGTNPADSAQ